MAMHMDSDEDEAPILSEINVTPLVDVMLVLLVIFMITAPLVSMSGVPVELPKANAGAIKDSDNSLWVTIDKNGTVYVDKRALTQAEFDEKFRKIVEARAPKDVFIRADENVPYGYVARAMAEVQAAGVSRVGMVTESPRARRKRQRRRR